MKQCIKHADNWLKTRPKVKEWLWFVLLWAGGMISFSIIAYPIKVIIRSLT